VENMTDHAELESLLGAYALDAVDDDEAAALEAHIPTCPKCSAELASHRVVTGLFAYSGQEAPVGLWDRITAGIQENPPELRLDRIRQSTVRPAPSRRPARRWLMTAAAIAAVVIAALAVEVGHLSGRTTSNQSAGLSMAQVRKAVAEPGSRTVKLTGSAGSSQRLMAVITPQGTGYLFDEHLTPLASDRTYQLWGVVGNVAVSYGLLGNHPGIVSFDAGPGVRALAVTDEVAGGVVVSHAATSVSGVIGSPV
jgi:hypothetical protein